ncbi:MAG: TonB-dependent siderophore receptor, partial [Azoarcus sp.]|nr:TonB-dependent siderophore receptor [Azoarcus sp.]
MAGVAQAQNSDSQPAPAAPSSEEETVLPTVTVTDAVAPGVLPPAYAGGQVARGGRVGLLGNKDFMETPFNTISYTEEFIRNRQAQDIGSVIGATDASVYVPSKRNIMESYYIRGFQTDSFDLGFNGLFGMAPMMRGAGEIAERLEVLKGPSAMLNGMPPSGSIAGSINIVPKRAADEPLTRLSTTYESDSLFGGHVDIGRRFGADKQFGLRFNGVYRDGDTAVDDQQHKMQLAALGLDWRGQRARLSADLYKQKERLDGVSYFGIFSIAPTVNHVPSPKKGDAALAPAWAFNINDTETVVLRGEIDLTDKISAHAAWGRKKGSYNALVGMHSLLNDAGDINGMFIRQVSDSTEKSWDIGLRGKWFTGPVKHDWSVAATNFERESGYRRMSVNHALTNLAHPDFGAAPDLSGFSTGGIPKTSEIKLGGIAVADTLSFAQDRVQLTLGIRRQQVETTNINAATGARTKAYDKSATSPSVALLFLVAERWSLYGNYIEGLSQGGTAPATAANANEVLPPYKTKQYELGAKYDQEDFAVTFSLFQIAKPGAYVDPVTNIYGENGEQRNRGLEVNFFGEPRCGLRVNGGMAYTQAELRKQVNGLNDGHQVTGAPKIVAKLGVEYDLDFLPGLTLTGGVNYTGKRYVTNDHRLSLPSYSVFDLGARYATRMGGKPLTLRANIHNLANKAYWI